MQYSRFAIDESPFCVWEWDLQERNLAFINSIDPTYFEYLANVHVQALEIDEHKQHAALSLRTAYAHGLETFFALLFATIQAPDCVIGWVHKYEVQDLRNLIQKVETWRPILSKLMIEPINWESLSNTILLGLSLEDKAKENRIKEHFATAWARFAHDYAHEKSNQEYNSIKHGFRACAGGFRAAIGKEEKYGIPAPAERMRSMGGSDFGSSFFIPEKIGVQKLHFRVRRYSINWRPERFLYGLHIISFSLQNILSCLKVVNGVDARTVQFSWPSDESRFEELRRPIGGVIEVGLDTTIRPEHIELFTKQEILDIYKEE